jgi:hypothetical protein
MKGATFIKLQAFNLAVVQKLFKINFLKKWHSSLTLTRHVVSLGLIFFFLSLEKWARDARSKQGSGQIARRTNQVEEIWPPILEMWRAEMMDKI